MDIIDTTPQELMRIGREAMGNENFEVASRAFKKAAEGYLGLGQSEEAAKAYGFAGLTDCCYRNTVSEGLSLLRQAAELGYADLDKLDSVGSQIHLGKPVKDLPEFKEIETLMTQRAEAVKVLEWINPFLDDWRWMNFPKPDDSRLVAFKARVPALTGGNEFDDIRLALEWLHARFSHGAVQGAKTLDLLSILECAKDKEINCIEMAALFVALLQANGHYSRRIAALRKNYHYGTGKGHWLAEVWSETFNRWIVVDVQNACFWKRGEDFLNACEITRQLEAGETARIDPVGIVGNNQDLKSWLDQFQAIWIYRNQNVFETCDHMGEVEELGPAPKLLYQGRPRARFGHRSLPDRLYPIMNKVHYEVSIQGAELEFHLQHSMPFWMSYEYALNDSEWKLCSPILKAALPKGKTKYSFRGKGLGERHSSPAFIILVT